MLWLRHLEYRLEMSMSRKVMGFLTLAFCLSLNMGSAISQPRVPVITSVGGIDNCLRDFAPDSCYDALTSLVNKNPKMAFEAAKAARLKFAHWTAAPFFAQALSANPTEKQCADADLEMAVLAGLGRPVGMAGQAGAVQIFQGQCFKALQPAVEKEVIASSDNSYIRDAACPTIKAKAPTSVACIVKVAQSQPVGAAQVLPNLNLATAKIGLAKAYRGGDGERVVIADVTDMPSVFLIRIDGVRSPINGKTLIHREEALTGAKIEYWTMIEGKRWTTLIRQGNGAYQVFSPALRDPFTVSFSDRDTAPALQSVLRE
jgi:hypothetical protein